MVGAGWQCGSSRVCPEFVLCLDFVLNMSRVCPYYVLVQCMTNICLQYQTFVLAKSNICPSDPTFVLSLSCWATKIDAKSERQNLVKLWTWLFTPLPSGHPAAGQNLDNHWTLGNPKFVHLLSMSHFPSKMHVYHSILCWDKCWTNIRRMSNLCPARPWPTHGPPMAHPWPSPCPLRHNVDKCWTKLGQCHYHHSLRALIINLDVRPSRMWPRFCFLFCS